MTIIVIVIIDKYDNINNSLFIVYKWYDRSLQLIMILYNNKINYKLFVEY